MRLFVALTWVQERRKQASIAARHAGRCHRRIQQHGKWKWWLRLVTLNPCWSHFLGTCYCEYFIHVFSCGVLLNFLSFSWFDKLLDTFCAQKKNDHCSERPISLTGPHYYIFINFDSPSSKEQKIHGPKAAKRYLPIKSGFFQDEVKKIGPPLFVDARLRENLFWWMARCDEKREAFEILFLLLDKVFWNVKWSSCQSRYTS